MTSSKMSVHAMQDLVISPGLAKNFRRNFVERIIEIGLLLSAVVAVFITSAIVYILVVEAIPFFQHVSLYDFLTT